MDDTTDKPKTVGDILALGQHYLSTSGIGDARLKCELLLSRLLVMPRLELALHGKRILLEVQLEAMRRGLKRLRDGEPVQHVVGEAGFWRQVFKSDRRALVPRPETEVLVARVLADTELWSRDAPAIMDVGTGSGCIVLSLAAAHPDARYLAVDLSGEAIALARENAARLDLDEKVIFIEGTLGDVAEPEMLDAIVANLPYIPSAEIAGLELCVREYEPRLALDGGPSGLEVIADLVADAAIVLKSGGKIFLEIGEKQGSSVVHLLTDGGFCGVEVLPDLNGRDRVVTGTISSM